MFPHNWTFWICLFLQLMLFVVFSASAEEMNPEDNKKDFLSHHPVYSIFFFVNNIQTKLSRISMLFL